jgi:thiamine biosynthesis lipoprotein
MRATTGHATRAFPRWPAQALLGLALLALGCGLPGGRDATLSSRRKTSLEHFGSVSSLLVFDDFRSEAAGTRFEATWAEIDGLWAELDRRVSLEVEDSDISRFNEAGAGEGVAISPLTAELVRKAIELYRFTDGAFDPAVANLVDLWGFSPRFRKKDARKAVYDRPPNPDGSLPLPDPRYVEAFRRLADFSAVVLSGDAESGYRLTKKSGDLVLDGLRYTLKIDLGGIAKGFGADKALEILKRRGYVYGYVNLGMSSLQLLKRDVSEKGARGANLWAVGMSNPEDRSEDYLEIYGKDTGVSTSGTDLHYSLGGRVYSHIIDPTTGEPTTSGIVSVTILGREAAQDDALTTALCVMGREGAEAFMRRKLGASKVAILARGEAGLELITNMADGDYAFAKK